MPGGARSVHNSTGGRETPSSVFRYPQTSAMTSADASQFDLLREERLESEYGYEQ